MKDKTFIFSAIGNTTENIELTVKAETLEEARNKVTDGDYDITHQDHQLDGCFKLEEVAIEEIDGVLVDEFTVA